MKGRFIRLVRLNWFKHYYISLYTVLHTNMIIRPGADSKQKASD